VFAVPEQVLSCLGPLSLKARDHAGAREMLTSSFALAKHLNDLPGQIAALRAVHALCVA